jgi:hypothetical protein
MIRTHAPSSLRALVAVGNFRDTKHSAQVVNYAPTADFPMGVDVPVCRCQFTSFMELTRMESAFMSLGVSNG